MTDGDLILVWLLFGGVIGFAAAKTRGYSPVAGAVGGAFLGILSPLLFFVDRVSSADDVGVPCPFCAEKIKKQAVVCKHCGRDIPKAPEQPTTCQFCGATVPAGGNACPSCNRFTKAG